MIPSVHLMKHRYLRRTNGQDETVHILVEFALGRNTRSWGQILGMNTFSGRESVYINCHDFIINVTYNRFTSNGSTI